MEHFIYFELVEMTRPSAQDELNLNQAVQNQHNTS